MRTPLLPSDGVREWASRCLLPLKGPLQSADPAALPAHPPSCAQGAGVTNTIRGGIADLDYYKQKPDLYM